MNTEILMAAIGLLLGLILLSCWHQYRLYEQTRQLHELILQQVKRAETAESFGYLVAHDLRIPLLQIRNRVSRLYFGLPDCPDLKAQVRGVEQIANAADLTVKQLLQLHRLDGEGLLLSEFDMGLLVKSTYEEVKETTGYLGSIAIANLPKVRADRVLVHQVWQNLFVNGVKFGADGQVAHLEVSYELTDEFHRFCLTDNGRGLPSDALVGIFEPFEQLTRLKSDGHGLGLAIVKRIVQKHGGEVWAESLPQGARFGFSLPQSVPQENKSLRSI